MESRARSTTSHRTPQGWEKGLGCWKGTQGHVSVGLGSSPASALPLLWVCLSLGLNFLALR